MRLFLSLFFLFINLVIYAQEKTESKHVTKKGKKGYADLVAGVNPGIVILDKNLNYFINGYLYNLFSNKLYGGLFLEKKYGTTLANSPILQKYVGGNLEYANGGLCIGKYYTIIKKKQEKEEIKMLTRINISLKAGIGRIWLINEAKHMSFNRFNYIAVIIPSAGVERPLTKFISVGGGVNYRLSLMNYIYFKNSTISGPGVYVNMRISLMNNSFMKQQVPAF